MPLSRLTIAAMWDLGYFVNLAAADAYGLPGSLNQAPVITSNGGGDSREFRLGRTPRP